MKSISADMIPEQFWRIRYDPNHDPDTPTLPSISDSPNCQNFAYALLRHFGFEIFPFRSSDLWEDSNETCLVSDELRPLDLLLFNRTQNPWGAHIALYLGGDHAIHLSKKAVGTGDLAVGAIPRACRVSNLHRREAASNNWR